MSQPAPRHGTLTPLWAACVLAALSAGTAAGQEPPRGAAPDAGPAAEADVAAVREAAINAERAKESGDPAALRRWVDATPGRLARLEGFVKRMAARHAAFAAVAESMGEPGKQAARAEAERLRKNRGADPTPADFAAAEVTLTGDRAEARVPFDKDSALLMKFRKVNGQWKAVDELSERGITGGEPEAVRRETAEDVRLLQAMAARARSGGYATVDDFTAELWEFDQRDALIKLPPPGRRGAGDTGFGAGAAEGWGREPVTIRPATRPATTRPAAAAATRPAAMDRPLKPVDVRAFEKLWSQLQFERLASPSIPRLAPTDLTPAQAAALKKVTAAYDAEKAAFMKRLGPLGVELIAVETYIRPKMSSEEDPKKYDQLLRHLGQYGDTYRTAMLMHRRYRQAVLRVLSEPQRERWARAFLEPYVQRRMAGVTLTREQAARTAPYYAAAVTRLSAPVVDLVASLEATDEIIDQIYENVLTDAQRARMDPAAAVK